MRLRRTIFAAAVLLAFFQAIKTGAATLPPGFQETIVFSGLTRPTAVRFASDGRVFVAEKSGLIKVFESLSSPTPTIFADLRTEIDDYWDRGLLGLALHPDFPETPYVYVLYSYDAPIGGTAPTWNDACPNPPGHGQRLRDQRTPVAPDRVRQRDDRRRRRSCSKPGASSFPAIRSATCTLRPTAPSTSAAATAPGSTTWTTGSSAFRRIRWGTRPCPSERRSSRRTPRGGRCAARASGAPRAARP